MLLAGHSLCGSRPSIGLVSGAIVTNLVFLESVPKGDYVRPHQAFFQFPGAIHGHSMGVWWGFGRGVVGVWQGFDGGLMGLSPNLGMAWGFGGGLVVVFETGQEQCYLQQPKSENSMGVRWGFGGGWVGVW